MQKIYVLINECPASRLPTGHRRLIKVEPGAQSSNQLPTRVLVEKKLEREEKYSFCLLFFCLLQKKKKHQIDMCICLLYG
jgi:hypothetical protein